MVWNGGQFSKMSPAGVRQLYKGAVEKISNVITLVLFRRILVWLSMTLQYATIEAWLQG